MTNEPYNVATITKEMRDAFRKGAIREILWMADNTDYIVDTETTCLDIFRGEPIQIALIDMSGELIFNEYLIPQREISEGAIRVHGKTLEVLESQGAVDFNHIWQEFYDIIDGKTLTGYNSPFDAAMIYNTARRRELPVPSNTTWLDAQIPFSRSFAMWETPRKSFRWMKLGKFNIENRELHDALSDCHVVLDYINKVRESVR